MNISFAYTTPAIIAREKTCTRRNWPEKYAALWKLDRIHIGWDRQACYGGHKICTLRLIDRPYPEFTRRMTEDDYKAEGFLWMEANGISIRDTDPRVYFRNWRKLNELVYVVRFEILELLEQGQIERDQSHFGIQSRMFEGMKV